VQSQLAAAQIASGQAGPTVQSHLAAAQIASGQAVLSGGGTVIAPPLGMLPHSGVLPGAHVATGVGFGATGFVPTSDLNSINSYNSYTSNDSLSSVRGFAMSKALQQARGGMLSDDQVSFITFLREMLPAMDLGGVCLSGNF
jgi:hypothetical protein